jgi:hypothetical protein
VITALATAWAWPGWRRVKNACAIRNKLAATLTLDELLDQAAHEAAMLRHPYIGPEHVQLAAAALVPDRALYDRLRGELLERAASSPGSSSRPGWPEAKASRTRSPGTRACLPP